MAMSAGATYVCPLVGRLQDQGHDALSLVAQCVETVNYYGYDTRIMFSSVRNAEHVRNALNVGAHTITAPWKVMRTLTENHFTAIGTQQFVEHTRLMTVKVKEAMTHANPIAKADMTISECLVVMTAGGFGAVTIVDENGTPIGIFTDGDLRRLLSSNGVDVHKMTVREKGLKPPLSVDSNELLNVASQIFKEKHVDVLVVTEKGKAIGMLDIQDLVSDTL